MSKSAVHLAAVLLTLGAARAQTAPLQLTSRDFAAFRDFAHVLLEQKQPAAAYDRFTAHDFVQRNPPFGTDRASTIQQWLKMTANPGSHFDIESISFSGDVAQLNFHGVINPGQPGAEVVMHDRMRNGRIVEEWAEFHVLGR
jgi:predicted SnoaL-like aldol condensation-catalyzing enzyme